MNFVEAHDKDAAIAAALALALDFGRAGEFKMVLNVAEARDAGDIARAGRDLHMAVGDLPPSFAALDALPTREIAAVEEDDRVGGRSIIDAGSDGRGGGSPVVVDAIG